MMEKSILQLSKESLTELSSLPHLKTKPKPEARPGTAGRIGPATLPKDKKKKTEVGSKTSDRIISRVGSLAKRAYKSDTGQRIVKDLKGHAVDTAIGAGKDIITGIGNRLAGRKNR
jgi:hypothetical protein